MSEALLFAEHGENMLCTKIVLNVRNNFCTQHVLPRFELGIFMYWTCDVVVSWCKKKRFWQIFTCTYLFPWDFLEVSELKPFPVIRSLLEKWIKYSITLQSYYRLFSEFFFWKILSNSTTMRSLLQCGWLLCWMMLCRVKATYFQ